MPVLEEKNGGRERIKAKCARAHRKKAAKGTNRPIHTRIPKKMIG